MKQKQVKKNTINIPGFSNNPIDYTLLITVLLLLALALLLLTFSF